MELENTLKVNTFRWIISFPIINIQLIYRGRNSILKQNNFFVSPIYAFSSARNLIDIHAKSKY